MPDVLAPSIGERSSIRQPEIGIDKHRPGIGADVLADGARAVTFATIMTWAHSHSSRPDACFGVGGRTWGSLWLYGGRCTVDRHCIRALPRLS